MKLVSTSSIAPSDYNPRLADEARLRLVGLSLRKLGFVLPLIADEGGEIISGHQRHLVACRLGFEQVPALTVKLGSEAARRALNIVFNRGTNDALTTEMPSEMTARLQAVEVEKLAAALPDADDPFRCLSAVPVQVDEMARMARARYDAGMRNMARALYTRAGIMMPVIATKSGRIVNGVGRVQYASERGMDTVPVVWIADGEADFAFAMLNLLSMDFDFGAKYADYLRYNSFRRARSTRKFLGTGFTLLVSPGKATKEFDIANPIHASAWKRAYGTSVCDFGAGHLHETELLRSAGVDVTPFEPYRIGEDGMIDKAASVEIARAFLDEVAAGKQFHSVFLSSVLNSIPFKADRERVIRICAALSGPRTRFFANAMAVTHENYTTAIGIEKLSKRRQEISGFDAGYEPGVILGEFMDKPKVQKYHTGSEFYELMKVGFRVAQCKAFGTYFSSVCAGALPPDPGLLGEALDFEFDLPYPDGSRMGLASEARAAFAQRLGITL